MSVSAWWTMMCVISVCNIAAWLYVSRSYFKNRATMAADIVQLRLYQVLLSSGYVFVCAFRSWFPRADVQRINLYDHWISSVFVGRSAATIAELCFVAQWALILRELSRGPHKSKVTFLSYFIVPFIFVAECFSWYSVATTNYIGNMIEESIWAAAAFLMILGVLLVWKQYDAKIRRWFLVTLVGASAYVMYMVTIDVPRYFNRFMADQAANKTYLNVMEGLRHALQVWTTTHKHSEWRDEIVWMAVYFSVAVWFSIALIRAPRFADYTSSPDE